MSTKLTGTLRVVSEKNEWDDVMEQMLNYDFYHTFDYHVISQGKEEKPILITYEDNDRVIAIPLMMRNIDDTGYNDLTSAYGYCGPVSSALSKDFDNKSFTGLLNEYLNGIHVVSAFSRLNPFIKNQALVLNGLGEICSLSKVVNIDLTLSLDLQRKEYNPRLRTYINKCREMYLLKEAESEAEIKKLVAIYYENMLRINAKDRYFFPGNYFINLWKSKGFNSKFILAYDKVNGKLAGGAIFVMVNNIVQYHLSGVKKEYLKLSPIKLLLDEMRIIATEQKYTYYNLGGGVGNSQDSLLHFKSGFSKDFKSFKVWKYIVNQKVYDELVANRNTVCGYDNKTCQQFFPCYRCQPQP